MEQLIKYYNKFKYGEELYHKLMAKRVKKILLISTFYNAFAIEEETKFSEQIIGGYHQFNLTSIPVIKTAINGSHAINILKNEHFDLIISTLRIGEPDLFQLSQYVKSHYPDTFFILLLTESYDAKKLNKSKLKNIDNVFLWSGNPSLFIAMIKSIEDFLNAPYDTKEGGISIILLIEDSVNFYSIYLPEIYNELMVQTQNLISEEASNDIKYLRMRTRPKVLIAKNLEFAKKLYYKYKDNLLCVITDLELEDDDNGGLKIINLIKQENPDIPILAQSSDGGLLRKASKLGVDISHKNTPFILNDFHNFLLTKCGFGDFIFRDESGNEIAVAKNIYDFEKILREISIESFNYHAKNKHFCKWLIARGELTLSKKLMKIKKDKFKTAEKHKNFLINVFKNMRIKQIRGKILDFNENAFNESGIIFKTGDGSLGGKGRGLSFLNTLFSATRINKKFKDVIVNIPKTLIVCTSYFDEFIENNYLYLDYDFHSDGEIISIFQDSEISDNLIKILSLFLKNFTNPIAVRSSGLLEDSQFHPFAGIYKTVMLPNNGTFEERLNQLISAVKYVYSSVYLKEARAYLERLDLKLEEEKMAVIIQEIIGKKSEQYFYPDFSGVAQSFNYYPISYIKHQDGVASLALGLGKYVVGGGRSFRFCPKYPEVNYLETEDLLKITQTEFYALDLNKKDDNSVVKLPVFTAEKHNRLHYIASTWDPVNQRIEPGISKRGARVINFENILKYDYFPLSEILTDILGLCEASIGTPVEMEFAVNLGEKSYFYVLQVRPLTNYENLESINLEAIPKKDMLLYTETGCGCGLIDNINHIVFLEPDKFDSTETIDMQKEIAEINNNFKEKKEFYILIGPGRWGSRDKFLGIPVNWDDISMAKTIVEVGLKDYDIEPSQGTHFMHNIISMNIGYFNVPYYSQENAFIDWNYLLNGDISFSGKFFKVIKSNKSQKIVMDGKKGRYAVLK